MRSTLAVLSTTLLFPLMLYSQHGSSASSGGSSSSSSSSASSSASSLASSSASSSSHSSGGSSSSASSSSSSSSGASSHASSGGSGARDIGSSNHSSNSATSRGSSVGSRSSATQHGGNEARNVNDGRGRSNGIQSRDFNIKGKPVAGNSQARPEHVKRGWLPWKWHSNRPAKKEGDNKPKCKPGKPCKGEEKLVQADEDKLKCIHGSCKVCPPGYSLNNKGACASNPPSTTYNTDCIGGSPNINNAGEPCGANSATHTQNSCGALAAQVQQEEMDLQTIGNTRQSACSQNASNQECLDLGARYQREALRLEELRREYQACLQR